MRTLEQLYAEYDDREERRWGTKSSDDTWCAIAVTLDSWPHDTPEPTTLPLRRCVRFELAKQYGDIESARFAFRQLLLELLIEWGWSDSNVTSGAEDVAECLYAVGFGEKSFNGEMTNVGKRHFIEVLRQTPVGDRTRYPVGAFDNVLYYSAHLFESQKEEDDEYLRSHWNRGIDPFTVDYFMECWKRDEETGCGLDVAFHLARVKKPGRPASDDGRNLRIAWLEHRRRKQIEYGEHAREKVMKARSSTTRLKLLSFVAALENEVVTNLSQRRINEIYDDNLARVELLWKLMEKWEELQGANLPNIKSLTRNPFDPRNRRAFPLKPPADEQPH